MLIKWSKWLDMQNGPKFKPEVSFDPAPWMLKQFLAS